MSTPIRTAKILITGANGFVAQNLIPALKGEGYGVIGAVRRSESSQFVSIGAINGNTNWERALIGVDTVIHLASRVHQMKEMQGALDSSYKEINVEGTMRLAQSAMESGVKQFIFLSSIKVNGEQSLHHPCRVEDEPSPQDAYARSKLEAEYKLKNLCTGSTMNLLIIRPSLIYGPGVKGNFYKLMKWVYRCYPLPFAEIDNQRTLLSVYYLNDFVLHALKTPDMWNKTYLLGDAKPVSTPELILKLARALRKKNPLVWGPIQVVRFLAKVVGKSKDFERMASSLEMDVTEAHNLVKPSMSVDQALKKTADWFREDIATKKISKKR